MTGHIDLLNDSVFPFTASFIICFLIVRVRSR